MCVQGLIIGYIFALFFDECVFFVCVTDGDGEVCETNGDEFRQ